MAIYLRISGVMPQLASITNSQKLLQKLRWQYASLLFVINAYKHDTYVTICDKKLNMNYRKYDT